MCWKGKKKSQAITEFIQLYFNVLMAPTKTSGHQETIEQFKP